MGDAARFAIPGNNRGRLRLGYAYAENPLNPNTGNALAGISLPGGFPAIKYLQAQFGVINQHRIYCGRRV